MNLPQKRLFLIIILIIPYILTIGVILNSGTGDLAYTLLRSCGLLGFLSLSLGVMINLGKKEMKPLLGKPFIAIHHLLVLTGLVLITLHPVILAFLVSDLSVFIPDISSMPAFLTQGGRVAIVLIYIGFLAAVFRSALRGRWILIHRIMYPAFLLGIIHANLAGGDLSNPVIKIMYNGIAAGVIITGMIQWRSRFIRTQKN